MKLLPLIMLALFAICCSNNKTGKSYIAEDYSDTLDWEDDTPIYKGDTIVYACWLKHCDSIAIDTIMWNPIIAAK